MQTQGFVGMRDQTMTNTELFAFRTWEVPALFPMSLLRACLQTSSIYSRAHLRSLTVLGRGMANNSTPTKNKSSEIVAPEPVREVLVADVISGAPGVSEGGGKTCAMNS